MEIFIKNPKILNQEIIAFVIAEQLDTIMLESICKLYYNIIDFWFFSKSILRSFELIRDGTLSLSVGLGSLVLLVLLIHFPEQDPFVYFSTYPRFESIPSKQGLILITIV